MMEGVDVGQGKCSTRELEAVLGAYGHQVASLGCVALASAAMRQCCERSLKTSGHASAPNGNVGFGPAPTQTRSGAWGWLASSSQILNHSAFHQSFMLIQLSAFGIVSPPQKTFLNPCQGRMKTGRLYDVLTLGRLSDRISA